MIAHNPDTVLTDLPAPPDDGTPAQATRDHLYPAILVVTDHEADADWIGGALSADNATFECLVEVTSTSTAALGHLHVQTYHALVVRHAPPAADAVDLLDALQLAGVQQPVVVLADDLPAEIFNRCYELGAEAVLPLDGLTRTALSAVVKRAVERFESAREMVRLTAQERRRLIRDRDEAEQLLEQQRLMIRDLEAVAEATDGMRPPPTDLVPRDAGADREASTPPQPTPGDDLSMLDLPDSLVAHYRELLRTYVIMGSGSLRREIRQLSRRLAALGTSPRAVMNLHLLCVEQTVRGLGKRSSRHVMSRAHLLALEIMVHLARCYQHAWAQQSAIEHNS